MDDIAVIGFSFKFPQGADDERSFWDVLKNGRNLMTPWPKARSTFDSMENPSQTEGSEVTAFQGSDNKN
jgi:acyl transferase domain-containing protein